MTSNIFSHWKHILILASCVSFLEKYLLKSLPIFETGCLFVFCLVLGALCIFCILIRYVTYKYCSYSVNFIFALLILSCNARNFKMFTKVVYFFILLSMFFWYCMQEITTKSCIVRLSSKSFIVLGFTVRILIHFELTSVYGIR